MLLTEKFKSYYNTESGRSMIEMLGVLAIVGVLSIGGVVGYKFAVDKFQANEIINELNMRAIDLSSQILNSGKSYVWDEVLVSAFSDKMLSRYPVTQAIADRNVDYFRIDVEGVESDVCRELVLNYSVPSGIFVDDMVYQGDGSICSSDTQTVDMGFLFKNDFEKNEDCGAAAEFYPLEQACHCIDDEYIRLDPNTNACSCISGYAWNEETRSCFSQLCPVGYFMTLNKGCQPCSTTDTMAVPGGQAAKDSCIQCGTRGYIQAQSDTFRCYSKTATPCADGSGFRIDNGNCISCSHPTETIHIGNENEEGYRLCNLCPNRYMNKSACTVKDMCELGKSFPVYVDVWGKVVCKSCSDPADYDVGDVGEGQAYCTACKNEDGESNRQLIGTVCRKTTCDSNEFIGSNGLCYKCDQPDPVRVTSAAASGCDAPACGREVVNGMCRKKCPTDGTHVQTADGACHDCSSETYFLTSKSECESCSPQRDWFGTTHTKASCVLKSKFTPGVTYAQVSRWDVEVGAQPCADTYTIGYNSNLISDAAAAYCEACPNNHVMDKYCISNDLCSSGSQFRSADSSRQACVSCDATTRSLIGTHPLDQKMCLDCTSSKRFYAGSYCYPCDGGDEPDVFFPEEESGCLACGNRIIENGKCIRPR